MFLWQQLLSTIWRGAIKDERKTRSLRLKNNASFNSIVEIELNTTLSSSTVRSLCVSCLFAPLLFMELDIVIETHQRIFFHLQVQLHLTGLSAAFSDVANRGSVLQSSPWKVFASILSVVCRCPGIKPGLFFVRKLSVDWWWAEFKVKILLGLVYIGVPKQAGSPNYRMRRQLKARMGN